MPATSPKPRPTRDQLATLIEEFALNSYRMMAGRNITTVAVTLNPSQDHPYFATLMNRLATSFREPSSFFRTRCSNRRFGMCRSSCIQSAQPRI